MAALGSASVNKLWECLSPAHRRWLGVNALAVPAVINASSSAAIAWLSLAGEHRVPVWSRPLVDKPGLVTDTLGTLLILPFLTTLTISMAAMVAQRRGRLPRLILPTGWSSLAARLPSRVLPRAGLMALALPLVVGPAAIAVLASTAFQDGIQPSSFVIYKVALAVALGAVFTPFIALVAMAGHRQISQTASAASSNT